MINLQLGSTNGEDSGSMTVLLDINYVLSQPEEIAFSQVLDRISRAHEKVEEIFDACITDKLRQKFGEAK